MQRWQELLWGGSFTSRVSQHAARCVPWIWNDSRGMGKALNSGSAAALWDYMIGIIESTPQMTRRNTKLHRGGDKMDSSHLHPHIILCRIKQFVVQPNHEGAELASAHKVAAEDVDSTCLIPGSLSARPVEQWWASPPRHGLHALEGMKQDVRGVLRQVQATDVKSGCETYKNRSGSCITRFSILGFGLPGLPLHFMASR